MHILIFISEFLDLQEENFLLSRITPTREISTSKELRSKFQLSKKFIFSEEEEKKIISFFIFRLKGSIKEFSATNFFFCSKVKSSQPFENWVKSKDQNLTEADKIVMLPSIALIAAISAN